MKRTLFLAASAIMTAFTNGEPMKLVNTKTGFVVVEFKQGKAEFHDRFLEAEMKETGILIPPSFVSQYQGKEVILLTDPLFEKAFIEIYYPLCIANVVYQWQK
jgi:hypothetical protein